MEITCSKCNLKLNVPDEKVPDDQKVTVTCPSCKHKITIVPKTKSETQPSPLDSSIKKERQQDDYDYPDDHSLDFYDTETKLALVMDQDNARLKTINLAVKELGYTPVSTESTRDALGKMRFHHFDIVFLTEKFDGQELKNNPVLNYLNHLSISSRRKIFLVLMGDQFKTMDSMTAYSISADMVINPKEIEKLPLILKKVISEKEKIYKIYNDTLVEVGKA